MIFAFTSTDETFTRIVECYKRLPISSLLTFQGLFNADKKSNYYYLEYPKDLLFRKREF